MREEYVEVVSSDPPPNLRLTLEENFWVVIQISMLQGAFHCVQCSENIKVWQIKFISLR